MNSRLGISAGLSGGSIIHTVNQLNVISLNINSLANKLNSLELYISTFPRRIDVVVLNETKLLPGEEFSYNLTGFNVYHQPRNTRTTRGGGVAIFTASWIQVDRVFGEIVDEGHFLGITISHKLSLLSTGPQSKETFIRSLQD